MFVSPTGWQKVRHSITQKLFFGNKPTPELTAILLVYFVQGILGLARLATSFFLKDELGLSPAEVSAMLGIAVLPWTVKPLFGFLSDRLPLFGYRRRPYLILSGVLGASAWVALGTVVHTGIAATAAIALSSLSVAVSDVIADSLVVERARTESNSDTGSLQSLCWAASALGGLITAYLSGSLLEHFSTRTVFLIAAAFPLILSAAAWLIAESPVSCSPNSHTQKQQVQQLISAITQKSIFLPTAFIFIWHATPTADSAFFFFTTNELGFQPEFLGRVRLATSIAALLGVWLFQHFFKSIPFRTIFGWLTLLSAALGMTTLILVTHTNRALGIDDHFFSLGDSIILTVIGKIAYMPVLVLAARLCPVGVEATLFALLMSVTNLAQFLSHETGAAITHWLGITETNFDNLWLLVLIANLSTLLHLAFLGWVPKENAQSESQAATPKSLPVLEPEPSNSNPPGQHIAPDFLPEMVPIAAITEKRTPERR